MMTPLPRPACGWPPWSPKKNRNQGSLAWGWRSGALLVLMLTTAAEARWAACRKLPGGGGPEHGGRRFDQRHALARRPRPVRPSHSGLSVATTK